MPDNMVIVTATDYVTVYPTTGFADHSSTPESTAIVSSIPTGISLSSASHSLMTSATAPLTPLPTSISSPQEQITSKPWSANLASAALAAIIIMALLLFSLIGHAIYQRYCGRCHNCTDNEKALAKWKSGDLKVITKAMVKERGSLNSIGGPVYEDLEKGAMACERQTARADALAALTRPESVVVKPKLWERAMGYMKGKNASEESAPVLPTSSSDRFFTVDPLPVTRPGSTVDTTWPTSPVHTFTSPERPPYPTSPVHIRDPSPVRAQPYTKHPVLDRAYSPPSPSMYSRATNGIRIVNRLSAQGVPAQHTYSEYMRNDGNTQPDMSTALNVRDKRRSRTYGGLPLPEGFVDVSLGEQR